MAGVTSGRWLRYLRRKNQFSLSEEQAFALVNEESPAYLPGAFQMALGSLAAVPRIADAFRSGSGMGWNEHDEDVFHGCEKVFRPGYAANLVDAWIPALHDVKQKLEAGARVADVGGFSTLLCTPCSRSQEVALCLGAESGEARIRGVVTSTGFNRFRRAAETPFNIVYEARP
jgi:hypothetical protein